MLISLFKAVILILVFSSLGLSYATPDGPDNFDVRGVASNDVLWMHPTADYKSNRIGKIPYDATCIKNLGCRGRWCKVNYRDTVGWVNGKYLMEGGSCTQTSYSNNLKRQKSSHQNSQAKNTSANSKIDQLYMQIYGRLDTRVAARRDYLKEVNAFIHKAASFLLKKYTIELELHNLKFKPESSFAAKNNYQKQLAAIKQLNGQTVKDYDGNRYSTIQEIEKAFKEAAKKSMEMQRNNYEVESEISELSSKLKSLLDSYGTAQQKKDIAHAEKMRVSGDRSYYNSLLENGDMFCIPDKKRLQKKPVFNSKIHVMTLFAQKNIATFLGTDKPVYNTILEKEFKKIETDSQNAKEKFRNDYLY